MTHTRTTLSILALFILSTPLAYADDSALDSIQRAIENAKSQKNDFSVVGTIELPKEKGDKVLIRRNANASLEVSPSDIVEGSVSALTKEELVLFDKTFEPIQSQNAVPVAEKQVGDWFRVKIKQGAECRLRYKTVQVDFVLDMSKQRPFYIDTEKLEVVYLPKRAGTDVGAALADCSNPNERCNQAVVVFYCYCCCRSKQPECYGSVGCGDGWSQDRCCPD